MSYKKMVIYCVLVGAISGCVNKVGMSMKDKNDSYERYINDNKLKTIQSVQSFRMRGWQALTDNYLILTTGVNKAVLLQMKHSCYELAHAHSIMINQHNSLRLSSKFDSVIVANSPTRKCYIHNMYPVSKQDIQALTVIGKPNE